ncbi:MAG: antitoxin HicB [Defluviitaleaceae bacterium]|nr:antitoxin HicB [Defluviitaleaceae bacterium]
MNKTLEYKGFLGSIEFSNEDNLFHGRIINVNGLYASYSGKCIESLKADFIEAVEFHLLPDENEAVAYHFTKQAV